MSAVWDIFRFIWNHPLARTKKYEAYKRFFQFQLGQRISPFPIIFPFTEKTKLIVKKGMTGVTGNVYCGLHDFEDMSFLLHFLRPEDVFVDVGANVGSYTVLATGHVGCQSIAFEPIPETFVRLNANLSLNPTERKAITWNTAVGPKKSQIRMTNNLDTINHVVGEEGSGDSVLVDMVSLDEVLEKLVPNLLKVDVEGFEVDVFEGAHKILASESLKAIIVEMNAFDQIDQILKGFGFKPYTYEPFSRSITASNLKHGNNMLYIRDLPFVAERIKTAPRFKVLKTSI